MNTLDSVVKELLDKKIAAADNGAVAVFLKQADIDTSKNPPSKKKEPKKVKEITSDGVKAKDDDDVTVVIQKQDGTHLYATTDLAALREVNRHRFSFVLCYLENSLLSFSDLNRTIG